MRYGMMYKQGDIVLIPVPYSDLTSQKRRPVLIISGDIYNKSTDDVIVAAITSNIRGNKNEIVFDNDNMIIGKLQKESCIRPDKIYTLSKSIIIKKFGEIEEKKVLETKQRLIEILKT